MAFTKGRSGNPEGRPLGRKNKISEELRENIGNFASAFFPEFVSHFKLLDPKDQIKFFITILPLIIPKLQPVSESSDYKESFLYHLIHTSYKRKNEEGIENYEEE